MTPEFLVLHGEQDYAVLQQTPLCGVVGAELQQSLARNRRRSKQVVLTHGMLVAPGRGQHQLFLAWRCSPLLWLQPLCPSNKQQGQGLLPCSRLSVHQ